MRSKKGRTRINQKYTVNKVMLVKAGLSKRM